MSLMTQRQALKNYYGPASAFAKRVDNMPDKQVLAIYFRLKKKGFVK